MEKRANQTVPSLEELKKMIKQENLSSSGRLGSLRLPRDLSLGGTKPKKIFTPNLNVVRNKDRNKTNFVKVECGTKRYADRSKDNFSLRHKNKKPKYMQSEGTFSQGMGELKRPTYHANRGGGSSYSRDGSDTASLVIPKINKNSWNNINKTEDTSVMEDLTRDEDSSSDSDNDYGPIFLPTESTTGKLRMRRAEEKGKDYLNSKIKKEIKTEDNNTKPELHNIDYTSSNSNTTAEFDLPGKGFGKHTAFIDDTKIYDEENPAFSLLRLPDSFVGKVWKDDKQDKNSDYTLKHMPEGPIGKIRIRKSGRMELIIKNHIYSLSSEHSTDLVEMAALFPGEQSIALEPSVVVLGTINERYTVIPEWNALFDCANQNNKFW